MRSEDCPVSPAMRAGVHLAAASIAVAIVVYPAWRAPIGPVYLLAATALALMLSGVITARLSLGGPGLAVAVLEYGVALTLSGAGPDLAAVALGAGVLAELELVDILAALRRAGAVTRPVLMELMRHAGGTGAAGVASALAAVLAGAVVSGSHPLIVVLSAAAGVGALLFVMRLTARAMT
jgi:hypothetical protein